MAHAYSLPQLFNPARQWIICQAHGWILSHVIHVAKAEWLDSHRQVIHSCIRRKKEAQVEWNVSIAARATANRAWKTGRVTERLSLGPEGETLGTRTRQSSRVLRSMCRQVEDTSLCQHAEPAWAQAFAMESQVIESIAKEHDTTSHSHSASSGTRNGMLSISLHLGPGKTPSALERRGGSRPWLPHPSNAATWPLTRTRFLHSRGTRWSTGQSITQAIIPSGCCCTAGRPLDYRWARMTGN